MPSPKPARSSKVSPPALPARTNEFAGLTDEARHELAVTRIRAYWVVGTSAVLGMGDTLVDACHDGRDADALADKDGENAMFTRIATTLGTIEGGPSSATLRNARRLVASNGTSASHFWRVLPFSHKVLLLPLTEKKTVAAGAQLAVEQSWTQKQLERWVTVERAKAGKPKKKRGVKLTRTRESLAHVAASAEAEGLERLSNEYGALTAAERRRVREELDRASAAIAKLRRKLGAVDDQASG